ncbi:MAG: zinc-binding dehydrogenase [Ignavibacteriales bacterium]|nr:zinc-binding dehydrogenase [Ignavibacteriales bacterium]
MKAIRFHQFGGADVLKFEDAPIPKIGPNEILLQLKVAALNHLDLWVRSGDREKSIPLPHIPGSDGAGVIAEVGSAVDFLKTGDKVLISPGISCGHCELCLSGNDNLCRSYHVLGTKEDGTYAEFVKLPATNVLPIPSGLDFNQAAAVPLVFLTAWHMLVGVAKIKPAETVLVHAAGSGVGSAAIQIAKLFGLRVITTAGTDEKLQKAKSLGADDVINYKEKDFIEEIKRLTNKRGVDIVFEHNGGEIFEKSVFALAKGGRLVTCGSTDNYSARVDLRFLFAKHLSLFGSFMGTKKEMIDVMKFFEKGEGTIQFQPVIDSVFPLEKAMDAHKRLEERKNFGKIVLSI